MMQKEEFSRPQIQAHPGTSESGMQDCRNKRKVLQRLLGVTGHLYPHKQRTHTAREATYNTHTGRTIVKSLALTPQK